MKMYFIRTSKAYLFIGDVGAIRTDSLGVCGESCHGEVRSMATTAQLTCP